MLAERVRRFLAEWVVRGWYQGSLWLYLLLPLSWLFRWVASRRRQQYLSESDKLWQPPVPVIVVGNITVGGTGKSPLVVAVANHLIGQGWRPGIISRGFGGKATHYPLLVDRSTAAELAGDEPVMLANALDVPIVVDPDRVRAAQYLLQKSACNIIVSDDGLQHYRLHRHFEIVVVDAVRGLGNGWCLPAGPLREPEERLDQVDLVVVNGVGGWIPPQSVRRMELQPVSLVRLSDGSPQEISDWRGKAVHAVAGIGNPDRFFNSLQAQGVQPIPHAFPDHQAYREQDLAFGDSLPIVMTAKDAVKCRDFMSDNMYVLHVQAQVEPAFYAALDRKLNSMHQLRERHG